MCDDPTIGERRNKGKALFRLTEEGRRLKQEFRKELGYEEND